eukprot:COSAG02_NODE_51691_length_312_cov_1.000000_1_plen_90_part_10
MDEAGDAEDEKVAVIELIVEKMRQEEDGGAQSAADLAAHQLEKRLQKVREELGAMKKSGVVKRARSIGITQEELDEAGDAEDEKVAVIEL